MLKVRQHTGTQNTCNIYSPLVYRPKRHPGKMIKKYVSLVSSFRRTSQSFRSLIETIILNYTPKSSKHAL